MTSAWRHQQAALEFWRHCRDLGIRGVLLAMCMGSGKTFVAIQIAAELDAYLVLVVCPLRVIDVWRRQFEEFSPQPYTLVTLDDWAGSVSEKTRRAQEMVAWARQQKKRLAIIVNYESGRLQPFAKWATDMAWPLVILDECHRLASPGSRTSRWAARLGQRAFWRLALTGTPMPHDPLNIWAQARFLDPYIFESTFSEFQHHYAVMGGYYDRVPVSFQHLDELEARMALFVFRVDDSVLDLPPELDQVLSCDLGPKGARAYQEMEEEMCTWLETDASATAANALVRLLRLQQITGGTLPDDLGRRQQVDTTKENLLADFLSDLAPDEPVVVFARFKSDLEAIHRAVRGQARSSGELSGSHDDLALWQRGGPDAPTVLAVQIQAGGLGVDLTRARIAVYYSFGFSLAEYQQSRARIRRPPQQRPCVFYFLQAKNTIDEQVLRAIERREELVETVLTALKQKGTQQCHQPQTTTS